MIGSTISMQGPSTDLSITPSFRLVPRGSAWQVGAARRSRSCGPMVELRCELMLLVCLGRATSDSGITRACRSSTAGGQSDMDIS